MNGINFGMTLNATNAPTGDAFQIANSPNGTATNSLLALGPANIAGGSLSGTYIGVNAANGFAGDLVNMQINGTQEFKVDKGGSVTTAGNINLPTTSSTAGQIIQNGTRLIQTIGTNNFSAGLGAGNLNSTATDNTAVGNAALASLSGAALNYNAAFGSGTLTNLTAGTGNTALGTVAMRDATSANYNTAVGYFALKMSAANYNTAIGYNSSSQLTSGPNTALGAATLVSDITGTDNVAAGYSALNLATSNNNTAVGDYAGYGTTGPGTNAVTTGSSNTFLGYNAAPGTSAQLSNATAIGANASVTASNSLVLGNGVNVGIGNTAPTATLDVAGQVHAQVFSNGAGTAIDWNKGNIQTTSAVCSGTGNQFSFTNMLEGGSYTLIVTGTATGSCNFNTTTGTPTSVSPAGVTGWSFLPANSTAPAGTAVYTMLRAGNVIYISWISGFPNPS